VRTDALAMKCRRGETSLTEPGVAFVSQQSLTEKPTTVADYAVLQKILVTADQNFLDEIRMVEKINVQPRGAVIKNVAELGCPGRKDGKRVRARQRHIADQKMWLRTWRTTGHEEKSALMISVS